MKISTAGNSKLLRQEDVHAPFVAIIQDVRVEKLKDKRGVEDDVYVVYFATGKPMKFNVINRKTVVAAYGDQRDAWIGKSVEIYVDPNVWMGSERTGGIRVRIPATAAATASHAGAGNRNGAASGTAPKPAPPPGVFPTLDERHAQLIRAINQTDSDANLNQWLRWGEQFPFSAQQRSEQAARRLAALERIALASAPAAPRRPAPARA